MRSIWTKQNIFKFKGELRKCGLGCIYFNTDIYFNAVVFPDRL